MARIEGISDKQAGLLTRATLAGAKRKFGVVPDPMRIYAHSRWSLGAICGFELAFGRARRLPDSLKTLASIKVSALVGCVF
jgi:hypothetical protein